MIRARTVDSRFAHRRFATTAASKGKSLRNIMRQGRWKDERVAMSYIRPATVFHDNATEGLADEKEPKK